MAEQTFVVNVAGYWDEALWESRSMQTGLVFIFEGQFGGGGQTVDLHRLLYIGDSEEVMQAEEKLRLNENLKKLLSGGCELCFAFAAMGHFHRKRIIEAYVQSLAPPANSNPECFTYDRTTVITTGNTALLYPVITVQKGSAHAPALKLHFRTRFRVPNRSLQAAYRVAR